MGEGPYIVRNCNIVLDQASPPNGCAGFVVDSTEMLIENVTVTTSERYRNGTGYCINVNSIRGGPTNVTIIDSEFNDAKEGIRVRHGQTFDTNFDLFLTMQRVKTNNNSNRGFEWINYQDSGDAIGRATITDYTSTGNNIGLLAQVSGTDNANFSLIVDNAVICNNNGDVEFYDGQMKFPNSIFSNVTCGRTNPSPGDPVICTSNMCPAP